jgi:prepilin-type N-terminal cleavage/methylation domain-containing protein
MFSDFPYSDSPQRKRATKNGFTLIELLMVIAVIGILVSITFGISTGVKNAQNRAVAKAQLASISQAVEQFKLRYGDYPWHDSAGSDTNKMLLYALTGRLVMERVNGVLQVDIIDSQSDAIVEARPKFIDETKFWVEEDNLLDPWGNPYIYRYKSSDNPDQWEMFGYHLYSTGPHEEEAAKVANEALKAQMQNANTGVWDDGYRDVANENAIIFAGE